MPATYTLIASNTLSSAAASVTFSSIPGTYTDLVLRASIRATTGTNPTSYWYANGDTSALYSNTNLSGNGATAASGRNSSDTAWGYWTVDGSSATANTFASIELYIPSYTASQSKTAASFYAQENNQITAYLGVVAGLYRSNTAITSLTMTNPTFDVGSSFFLYGIKNT
jgi:hypothetical protein